MNIAVINGSPKGEYSTTLQTVRFLEKKHPEHTFSVIHAGKSIRALEKDLSGAEKILSDAELILFCYPVYTFIAPSQLHRLIELIKERGISLAGKFASQITTSKHFYDVTAHRYIEDNCHDLGMKYVRGLSADMEDLLAKKGQKEAERFFQYLLWCVSQEVYEPMRPQKSAPKHCPVTVPKRSEAAGVSSDVGTEAKADGKPEAEMEAMAESKPRRIAIVADLDPADTALSDMIGRFCAVVPCETDLVDIHAFPFKGGCISCFNCSTDGTCIYRDGFQELLRGRIQTADAIVIAFGVRDHSMGARFKTYDDRQFCNGHRTVTMGKPFGYLVSGDLSDEENLRMILEGRAEVGGNFLAGIACDEKDPDREIDLMAARLLYAIENEYVQPSNFLGVGGMKIFRDLIWLMQGMMRADHRFYKAHGQYDFPQKKRGRMMLMYLVGAMMGNPKLKAKMGNKMNEGMIAPYRKVIAAAMPDEVR